MGIRRTEEFRSEAVRIALTSGLPQKQVAYDIGIGLSTLSKWVAARKHDELMDHLLRFCARHAFVETHRALPVNGDDEFSPVHMCKQL